MIPLGFSGAIRYDLFSIIIAAPANATCCLNYSSFHFPLQCKSFKRIRGWTTTINTFSNIGCVIHGHYRRRFGSHNPDLRA